MQAPYTGDPTWDYVDAAFMSAGLPVRIATHDSGSGDDPAVSFLKRAFAV